jgi:RimJ/RimL family protein N-acetyltransferase
MARLAYGDDVRDQTRGVARASLRRKSRHYWLAPHAVGHGYATEAARRLTRHAFDELESPRVEIRTEPHNDSSVRVAERLGFRREGVLRSVSHRRGGPIDLALYALLPEERAVLDHRAR